jgi:lambda family phage portal protein
MGLMDIFKRTKPSKGKRSYLAASKSRIFADFNASQRSPDSEIRWSLVDMRSRSRDLERNNEYMRRYLQMIRTNVVGESGVRLQLKSRNGDGSLDISGNNIIEGAWSEFCRLGGPTVDGRMSMIDLLNHIASATARDGEVFLRIVRRQDMRFGIGFQVLEPDVVDEQMNQTYNNGNQVRMGVELDKETRRPVAYHILLRHPGDYDYVTISSGLKRARIPASEILHIYRPERAEQTRGVPWAVSSIPSLKMLSGYMEAELISARTASAKMGFFTSPAGDEMSADDYENEYTPIYSAEPGTFHQLPAGVDFKAYEPSHPTSAFPEFEKAILRGVASGLGVAYTSLANNLEGTSYSSIRQGALDERDNWRVLQVWLIQHFLDPAYRLWLEHVMDFRLVPIYGEGKYFKFTQAINWKPRGFSWIDPMREMNASIAGLQNGILSHSDIAASYGRDAEETFSAIQRDMQAANQYGLTMAYQPFGDKRPVEASTPTETPSG